MITPAQCRAARAWFALSTKDLSIEAEIGINSITRIERGRKVTNAVLFAVEQAFAARGMAFNINPPGMWIKPKSGAR